jgi:hypothetical protein
VTNPSKFTLTSRMINMIEFIFLGVFNTIAYKFCLLILTKISYTNSCLFRGETRADYRSKQLLAVYKFKIYILIKFETWRGLFNFWPFKNRYFDSTRIWVFLLDKYVIYFNCWSRTRLWIFTSMSCRINKYENEQSLFFLGVFSTIAYKLYL